MIELNLIPDVKQELIRAQRGRSMVISTAILAGVIALGIIALLSIYVFAVQSIRSAVADEIIKTEDKKLASVQDLNKILTIQNQLTKITELRDQTKVTSRLFDVLRGILPPAPNNVVISHLTFDALNSRIILEGQAARDFSVLEIFKKTIDGAVVDYRVGEEENQVKLATDISTSDVSYGEDSSGSRVVRFTMSFVYPPELFAPSSSDVAIKLTNAGNVTDSYLGIPRSIFADRADDLEENN